MLRVVQFGAPGTPGVILGYANDVSERVIQFQEMEMGCMLLGNPVVAEKPA